MPSTSAHRIALAVASLVGCSLALAGCVHAGAGVWPVALLVAALSVLGVACGRTSAAMDASVDSAGDGPPDAPHDGAGTWENCCLGGMLTTCYCMPNWVCNYSRDLVSCGGGTCVYNSDAYDATPCDLWDDGPDDMGMDAGEDMGPDAADDMGTPP